MIPEILIRIFLIAAFAGFGARLGWYLAGIVMDIPEAVSAFVRAFKAARQ